MSYILVNSDARKIPLADKSVHCCVFSPPYLGARNYGVDGETGHEASMDCLGWATGSECGECFVCNVLAYTREVWRVLRDDGTLWLNIGDTLCKSTYGNGGTGDASGKQNTNRGANFGKGIKIKRARGVKIKDWCLIPERVVLALQMDGWYVRSKPVWKKTNPMPFPVTDRLAASYEMIYVFSKRERYFFDHIAIREPAKTEVKEKSVTRQSKSDKQSSFGNPTYSGFNGRYQPKLMREKRDVLEFPTANSKHAHFAVFPKDIPEIAIKAGTSEFGCCPECGQPGERASKKYGIYDPNNDHGWVIDCDCECSYAEDCTVLDIFIGSGTTAVVAQQLGRNVIGCDLSFDYLCNIAKQRIREGK